MEFQADYTVLRDLFVQKIKACENLRKKSFAFLWVLNHPENKLETFSLVLWTEVEYDWLFFYFYYLLNFTKQ